MGHAETTCWTMIAGAARGVEADRRAFVDRYAGVVHGYIAARWHGTPLAQDIDDAVQETFVESFRSGGILEKVDPDRPGGFRAFLFGVVRNVTRRFEAKRADRREGQAPTGFFTHAPGDPADADQEDLFDRMWARSIMREAAAVQVERANAADADAQRRVDLLRKRFQDGLPIRAIARLWDLDPDRVHRMYAQARAEFQGILEELVADYHPGSPDLVTEECTRLLAALD